MSEVFRDARLFVAGHDLSGHMNALALTYGADMLDATAMGDSARKHQGGLKSIVGNHQGLWESGAGKPSAVLFTAVGGPGVPVVIAPTGGDAGSVAHMFQATHAEYTPGGSVGELLPFAVTMEGARGTPPVRGILAHNGEEEGNVTGTAYQIGAAVTGQSVYAALHTLSGSGTFAVTVESDEDEDFLDPTARIVFATVATGTAVAAEWKALAGPVTDTWWRVTATNPATRNFAVAVGII